MSVQLQATDAGMNQRRRLFASVRARVFRTNDGNMLVDRVFAYNKGETRPLINWMLNKGVVYREQVFLAAERTAKMIVKDLFLPPSLSSGRPLSSKYGSLSQTASNLVGPNITVIGLKPIYPLFKNSPIWVDSLQPTLRWEPYQGENVTYDLKIWRSTGNVSEDQPELINALEVLLQPTNLTELIYNRGKDCWKHFILLKHLYSRAAYINGQ